MAGDGSLSNYEIFEQALILIRGKIGKMFLIVSFESAVVKNYSNYTNLYARRAEYPSHIIREKKTINGVAEDVVLAEMASECVEYTTGLGEDTGVLLSITDQGKEGSLYRSLFRSAADKAKLAIYPFYYKG